MTGKRLTGAARERAIAELIAGYNSGASIRTLVALTGHSYSFIHRMLHDAGVAMRRRGGANHTQRGQPTNPEDTHGAVADERPGGPGRGQRGS